MDAKPLTQFQIHTYIVTGIGIICSIVYLVGVPEVGLVRKANKYDKVYKTAQAIQKKKADEAQAALIQPTTTDENLYEDPNVPSRKK